MSLQFQICNNNNKSSNNKTNKIISCIQNQPCDNFDDCFNKVKDTCFAKQHNYQINYTNNNYSFSDQGFLVYTNLDNNQSVKFNLIHANDKSCVSNDFCCSNN